MALPIYQYLIIKDLHIEELVGILDIEMNAKQPVVLNLVQLPLQHQAEAIGLIENYFLINNASFIFPYPVYLITDHESSMTKMPTVKTTNELPRFFMQKDARINIKETHLLKKNNLLQQEIRNSETIEIKEFIDSYGRIHNAIHTKEEERLFYNSILKKLIKAK
jgi:hypothetical protein